MSPGSQQNTCDHAVCFRVCVCVCQALVHRARMCLQDRKVDKTTRPGTNIESKPSCFYVEETCLVQDPIVHAIVIVTTDQPIVWNDLRAACCPITKHRCRHRSRRRPNLAQPRRVQSSTAPHPSPPRRGQQGGDDRRRMEKGGMD